jgi:hypothetical protein
MLWNDNVQIQAKDIKSVLGIIAAYLELFETVTEGPSVWLVR